MPPPPYAPYMLWAKSRPSARFDLAGSHVLACSLDDLEGVTGALSLAGRNENGYPPLLDAIAARYGVIADRVTSASGTSGANFQVYAALLEPTDEVLVEEPGYDPLPGAARMLGARVRRFPRAFDDGYQVDVGAVEAVLSPRTRLIVLTSPHNPTGARASTAALLALGRLAESVGAHVLVDEVYLDAAALGAGEPGGRPAALLGDVFISTSSLTKSYGLASLRCGWALSSPEVAERIRRARDVIDGTGSVVVERLAALAFAQLDRLAARAAALLAANHAFATEFLARRPELEYRPPVGGTVLFPRIAGVADASRFAERLHAERDTAVVPGRYFEAPAHIRIGLGGTTESLRDGLAAIGAALDARAW